MALTTLVQTRKERRKLDRKKRKRRNHHDDVEQEKDVPLKQEESEPAPKKKKSKQEDLKKTKKGKTDSRSTKAKNDRYGHLDPDLADSIRRDDEEIAALGAKLGLKKSKSSKEKLGKEYSKLEGYGDDFGGFLDDLDDMVKRVSGSVDNGEHDTGVDSEEEESLDDSVQDPSEELYSRMDSDIVSSIRRDDEEIADLEQRLGLGKKKDKSKLFNEYKREGYGDDFGDFLTGLDDLVSRVRDTGKSEDYEKKLAQMSSDEGGDSDAGNESEESEELVPMKEPSYEEMDEDDSVLEELEREEDDNERSSEEEDGNRVDIDSDEDSAMADDEVEKEEPDHDISDTYRPSSGEDIYGNRTDSGANADAKPTKYVPPHLRNKGGEDDSENEEKLRAIRRGLNNALNRLSEDTMVSVAQQVSQLYSLHPTQMVHEMLWKNTTDACVQVPILMKGMIPNYLACIVGAHIQTGDTVQIAEYILEVVVRDLWNELEKFRLRDPSDTDGDMLPSEIASKHICNRMLILSYLYNYNIVHCSFLYDIIRHLIEKFSDVDIECLLLLLSHCGRSLRSDDPLALKEIVLLVQKKNAEASNRISSSRSEYMVSAITDLKNNKGRKQDTAYGEKTVKLRKMLGQIKSAAAKSNTSKTASESSLRISLQDILNADTKGRWWKVGASWVGNQFRYAPEAEEDDDDTPTTNSSKQPEQNEALLKLASKFRMNTDRKRAIFCIIMGSEDCEDAFEKLCRGSMLKNRTERDTCRVLFECCLNEKMYNKFYGHLASRMCEFQPQCKFSLQLAFWDMFKQFETIDARKAANLSKFLFDLVVTRQLMRLMTVVKAMDMSEDDMEESEMIFLTILMTNILDHFDDTAPIKSMFAARPSKEGDDSSRQEQEEGTRASLLVFFMETLKASPKNTKGTQFRKNFKAAVKALDTDGFENMF
jgi:nucleolar MIF4G domain-containing protein 1